jgi:hypothetical protein
LEEANRNRCVAPLANRNRLTGRKSQFGYAAKLNSVEGWNGLSLHGIVKFNFDGNEGKERNSFIAVVIVLPDDMLNGEWVPIDKFCLQWNVKVIRRHVYDGESMAPKPVLKVVMPYRVPVGFHGEWLREEDVSNHLQYWLKTGCNRTIYESFIGKITQFDSLYECSE